MTTTYILDLSLYIPNNSIVLKITKCKFITLLITILRRLNDVKCWRI